MCCLKNTKMGKTSKTKLKKLGQRNSVVKPLVSELFQKCVNPTGCSTTNPRDLFNAYKEINEMLDNIERYRAPSTISQLRKREDCIKDFLKWAREHGILFENIEIKPVNESELGVFATSNFNEGDLFITVPREAMMTSELASSSSLGSLIMNDPMLSCMPNVALAVILLSELYNKNSKWQPYINILPRSYTNILYFDVGNLENLKGTSLFLEALNVLRSIIRQYAYLTNLLAKHPLGKENHFADKFNFEDYKWAVATLMTRQNPIPSSSGMPSSILALIPVLDMCNHDQVPVSIHYNPEAEHCESFAATVVESGEEIKIYYGSRPNTELVMYNGFIFEGNSNDYINIKLGLSNSDEAFQIRKELTTKLGLGDTFKLGCTPHPVKEPLTAYMLIANASQEELELMKEVDTQDILSNINDGNICGQETKKKGQKFLRDRCFLFLRLIPGSYEGDCNLLEDRIEMSNTEVLSLMLRRNERKLLLDAIDYLDKEIGTPFE